MVGKVDAYYKVYTYTVIYMYIYMHTYMRIITLVLKMVLLFLSMLHIGGELEVATYRDRDRDCGTSPAISCMYAYICMYENTLILATCVIFTFLTYICGLLRRC